ncbi:MAG: SMC-Scp complex subunit ScpB [Bryobacteraceae bacterium]
MDAVEHPEASGVAEEVKDEESGGQANLGLEQPEAGEPEAGEDVLIAEAVSEPPPDSSESLALKAIIEAAIYITDEPLAPEQIATAVEQPLSVVNEILQQLVNEYAAPGRGLAVRELAGGYKMSTKPEYHESIRRFVKRLQPPLKLSLAALETLAVIAYKQPITGPEILDIRGVQGAGVLKTLLDRRLIATAGRKNVLGKPIMYKTTREFLIQFGLDSLAELPTLKEFEELGRNALTDEEVKPLPEAPPPAQVESGDQAPENAADQEGATEANVEADHEPKPQEETAQASEPVNSEAAEEPMGPSDMNHAEPNA